jgi:FtsP/CotA-like multicopper oxidase with cupredoxin domain
MLAKDGQPLASPLRLEQPLILAPAERYDLIADIPSDWEGGHPLQYLGKENPVDVARFQVTGQVERSTDQAYDRTSGGGYGDLD